LVLALQHGRIQAECVGVNRVYEKLGEGKYKGSMMGPRWSLLAERACFSFSGAFKTYINPWGGQTQEIPNK
jgi:hypothetical protein